MKRKMIWGLGILIIGLVIGLVFLGRQTDTEPEKVFILPSDEVIKQAQEANKPPREAKEGYKWVAHDDHFHEVPISEVDPATPVAPVPKTKSGRLTYHTELLQINPAEALYQQSLERGHWSAKWIPPFPPEDAEAQEFARNLYLREYYESIDDKKNPIYVQAGNEVWYKLDDIHDMPADARSFDLLKLTWARVPAGSVVVDWSDPSNFSLPRTDR